MKLTHIRIQNFLWLLPFVCFFFGYQFVRLFYHTQSIVMPRLIGKHLQEAVKMLSDQNLNIRILEEKETTEVPEGTILSQTPLEGQKIKPYQSIYLVLSQRSVHMLTPSIQNLSEKDALKVVQEDGLDFKAYKLASSYPVDTCIAQVPGKSLPMTDKKVIAYISSGAQPLRIMPNLVLRPVQEVADFLRGYGIDPQIFHGYELDESHTCDSCLILDQRPVSGSVVHINKPVKVQLRIGTPQQTQNPFDSFKIN